MGQRFNNARYQRPGGRSEYTWPSAGYRKVKIRRDGATLKRLWNDCFESRRHNNGVRRAADRAAVRSGLKEHAE